MSGFHWDLNPKREALMEGLMTCPGLDGRTKSERLENALRIFLREYVKRLPQSRLEKFGVGKRRSPEILERLDAVDLEEYSEEQLAELREACLRKADQFDFHLRKRHGTARTTKV